MATKTRTKKRTEIWRAKLGMSLAGVEGVRLGFCIHEGVLYSPAMPLPPYVVEFLGLRVEPADPMWPYYIDAEHKTLEQVMGNPPAGATIADADESIIEFTLEVEE